MAGSVGLPYGGKMEKAKKVCKMLAGVQVLIGLLLIAVVGILNPVCSGMLKLESGGEVFMKCHYTGLFLGYFGILLMAVGIFVLVVAKNETSIKLFAVAGMIGIVLGVCMILITCDFSFGTGVCANAEMACNLTAGLARLLGGLAIITGICLTAKGMRK